MTIFKHFLILCILGVLASSCQENGQGELISTAERIGMGTDTVSYELKLRELAVFMGEVFKDPLARQELFGTGRGDRTLGDIDFSLKNLFEEKQNKGVKKGSAILNSFYKNVFSHRMDGDSLNRDSLIWFITENNIRILAPYLSGHFDPNSLRELTVSWWTKEMEEQALVENPAWKGVTPGISFRLDDTGNLINYREGGASSFEGDFVEADDDYALAHPTLVFGNFDVEQNESSGQIISDPSVIEEFGTNTSPLCAELDPIGKGSLVVRMPEIQLNGNIRRWPNPNFLYLWVATGSFKLGSDGTPELKENIYHPISKLKVSRSEANSGVWVGTSASFVISNWEYSSENMHLIWASKRTKSDIDLEANVKASKKDGPSVDFKIKLGLKRSVELVSSVAYDKCFVLSNNRNQLKQGELALRKGYPVYEFSKLRSYFIIETI